MRIESFLKQSPVFQVNRTARRMDSALATVLAGEDLSVFEAMVLVAVFFEKRGEIKPSELAEAFQTTRGNVSHCISSLESKGLVERRIDPEDARGVRLVLKPFGRRRAVRVVAILDSVQRQIEELIGEKPLESMLSRLQQVDTLCTQLAHTAQRHRSAR
ncbi:MAG: winged helix-turn-helix transcriptional regulator [Acidobacteriota bacterium]|nr:winged helix-turn-helix transcriptional regulator [Acidobacteriota bacterium]